MIARYFVYIATAAGLGFQNLFAAAEAEVSRKTSVLEMLKMALVAVAPILIFGGCVLVCFVWFIRRQLKSPEFRTQLEYQARHQQHMERVEQTLERIAVALERKKKDEG